MNGISTLLSGLIFFMLLNVFIYFFVGWWNAIQAWRKGVSPLPFAPRKLVPWNILEFIAGILVFLLVLFFFQMVLSLGTESLKDKAQVATTWDNTVKIAASSAAMFIGSLFVAFTLSMLSSASTQDFGLRGIFQQVLQDYRIGFVTFAMLAPIVLSMQLFFVEGLGYKYEHPLIETLMETPDFLLFSVVAISAAIIAPITEELLFRAIVQGSLEKLFYYSQVPQNVAAIATHAIIPADPTDWPLNQNPYAAPIDQPAPVGSNQRTSAPGVPPLITKEFRSLPAILISSLIFGLLHYSHGPAWIPLTVLAIGLGYVYQQTHRLLPCIVVHALLNGMTVLQLALQLSMGETAAPSK